MLEQNLSERIKQFKKIDAHSHVGYFGSWCDVGITPEELIAQMDEYNVEKSVICTYPIQDSLDAVDKYPDRLVGAAWLNPMDPDCLDILKDAVKNHNFKAVKLHPLEQAYCPNDECVFPIAELAQELEIPLMIHTGHPPFSLPWSVAQLADIYPDLPMVMIHMGHGNGMFIQWTWRKNIRTCIWKHPACRFTPRSRNPTEISDLTGSCGDWTHRSTTLQ